VLARRVGVGDGNLFLTFLGVSAGKKAPPLP